MDKKLFQLLQKSDRTLSETQQVTQFMSHKYFRSLITPLPMNEIISNVCLLEWGPQTVICQQGQKINSYFFLIEGSVNVYKKVVVGEGKYELEIVKNINEPSIISDSFFTHSPYRLHTVITSDNSQSFKGFMIDRWVVEKYCNCLVKEYKLLKEYFCDFLNLSSDNFYKIDLYENAVFKTIKYGHNIKIDNQILVIYSGQCLMNFEEIIDCKRRNDSPFRTKQVKSRHYRPLLKLCLNDCFGMEQLFPQNIVTHMFKYTVTSQKLVCISIANKNLQFFPKEMTQKLKYIHSCHMEKLDDNIYVKNNRDLRMASSNCPNSKSLSPEFTQHCSPVRHTVKPEVSHDISGDFSQMKPKFLEIPLHRADNSPSNKKIKSRFRLPNIKFKKIEGNLNDSITHLNRTQVISLQKSPLKQSSVNMSDILNLRKKYCVGFDLKSKCKLEEENCSNLERLKQTVKEPRGYFPFAKGKKQKQNNTIHEVRVKKQQSQHKDWSCYIKLPKLC